MDTISIKEAAEYYGISRQAVHKKMLSTWKPYVVNQLSTNGKPQKRLYISVLSDFPVNQTVNQVDTGLHKVDKKTVNHVNQVDNQDNQQNTAEEPREDALTAFLMEQIRNKDEQIKSLQDANTSLLRQIEALTLLQAKQQLITAPAEDQKQQSWWYRFWHGTTPGK